MSFLIRSMFFGACCVLGQSAFGTNVGVVTVEQPINLCAFSDPTRIPLGSVPVEANYGYGIHRIIDAPRACPYGAMQWSGGVELNQNLASVFGISVEPEDDTQILVGVTTLRVKNWPKPAYSPYSKDQVLAATLWCLIRRSGSSEKHPLKVQVVVEGDGDQAMVKKYSGSYYNEYQDGQITVTHPAVPGTRLESDPMGFTWVVFPDVKPKQGHKALVPVMIPMAVGEEASDSGWHLAPVWGSDTKREPLELSLWSSHILYSCFNSHGLRDANAFLSDGGAYDIRVQREAGSVEVVYMIPYAEPQSMTASIWSLIMSTQPTEKMPLKVSLDFGAKAPETYVKWAEEGGWKIDNEGSGNLIRTHMSSEFVWDPVGRKLSRGKLPGSKLDPSGRVLLDVE